MQSKQNRLILSYTQTIMDMKKVILIVLLFSVVLISCKETKKEADATTTEETTVEETVAHSPEVVGEEVNYNTAEANMTGYIAYDKNKQEKRPGIIVVHEWWGHNDYVRQRADMLAEIGYTALAVDMYGDGKFAQHPQDAMKFSQSVMGNIDEATARFEQALALLNDHPSVDASRTAAIGYCFGGSVVLTMANKGLPLDAVAAFHSGVSLPVMPTKDLKAEVLVAQGADDPFIPKEAEAAFKKQMDSVGGKLTYVSYPGAVHAYTSKGADSLGQKFDLPLKYNEEADTKSWEELKKLLSRALKK